MPAHAGHPVFLLCGRGNEIVSSLNVSLPMMLEIMRHCSPSPARPHLLKGHGNTDHAIHFLLLDLPCEPPVPQRPRGHSLGRTSTHPSLRCCCRGRFLLQNCQSPRWVFHRSFAQPTPRTYPSKRHRLLGETPGLVTLCGGGPLPSLTTVWFLSPPY